MLGEDSCGRKVSLLNDEQASSNNTFTRPQLPDRSRPSTSSLSSRTSRSTCNSSRSSFSDKDSARHSPPTPPLARLDSRSSSSVGAQSTPSPMTPSYAFEPMDGHGNNKNSNVPPYYTQFNNRTAVNGHAYPAMQDPTPQPYYNLNNQQPLPQMTRMNDLELDDSFSNARANLQPLQTQFQNPYPADAMAAQMSPQAIPSATSTTASLPPISTAPSSIKTDPTTPVTNSAAASTPNAKTPTTNKKKYPCPHAHRFNCQDTFTTSGHAARHGKKHTGEKNIHCPTCNKAFTRKDNMKQHERTHKGGSRGGSTVSSPAISVKGGSRKGSFSATSVGDAMEVDIESNAGRLQRPKMKSELSEIIEGLDGGRGCEEDVDVDADGEGESPGLDALATAASEMV